jgi:excinuclease ABC subunit B
VQKEIKMLESQMYEFAKDLAFEQAADTRDRIAQLKNQLLKQ